MALASSRHGGLRFTRMMHVYLVRHAIAHERDAARWPRDSERPLTSDGERRFRRAARGLAHHLPRSAVILTSPFARARSTAELLAEIAQLRAPQECKPLSAGEPAQDVFEAIDHLRDPEVVLVGHEPQLGKLLSVCLTGDAAQMKVEFKKGGAACVLFRGRPTPGRGVLLWHLPPRMLRGMR
jgi:phosphohistidine phosphatase